MPNAKDFTRRNEKFLLIGPTGSGKTSQFLTLPGKKFMYIFDPNALNTLKGYDLDYELFTPEILNLNVHSLTKGVKDSKGIPDEPQTYVKWEKDFEDKIRSGFFKDYNVLGFDSFTTFADMVMDRVLWLNGRFGKQPEQPDWSAQINTISNVFRTATSLNLILFATGHEELRQDEITKRIVNQVILPGKLRIKIPLLFSEIYHTKVEVDEGVSGATKYLIQTKTDRYQSLARDTIGLPTFVDVTITDWKKPEEFGLGKILKEIKSK